MSKKRFVLIAVITFLVASALLTPHALRVMRQPRTDADYLRLFREVVTIVKKSYVTDVDNKKLMQGAVNGMLTALDPHSQYLPLTDFTEMKVHMAGAFGGVGIELGMENGKLTVNAPIEDTPAFRAGIQAGDHIYRIDGKLTKGMNINDAVSRMRGTPGTAVTLGIERAGSAPLSFRLVRAIIKTKSLKGRLLEPGIGYVTIAEFQERTGEDFDKALKTLAADNGGPLSGLILDLRYNPGGLVDQAFRVADRFIGDNPTDEGVIVTTKGREPSSTRSLTAYVGQKEPNYPMVVLINGGSASAAEIVAGALQDHKRAVIMGTQSFGKGSVQSIIQLPNGDGLKLTTARYYTPSGRSIQARGITPDIIVDRIKKPAKTAKTGKPEDKEDEIHEKDLEGHISGGDDAVTPPTKKPASAPALKKSPDEKMVELLKSDNQVMRAVDLLKGLNYMKSTYPLPAKAPKTVTAKTTKQ
ncbi:S41 family peptidase [Geomesophilobacter sediminis]|uniref:S41 family peptidase n=1 Tax=Geomesophilobacter sediminis TaxID=2798584 RepID=A0A8J7JA89_9BACT|nr:S41 family peptidase [Geomesophilobacter sediminis]MBJ6723188.1 S41 family peptidase [Geomesophilobacter sediminis]